MYDQIVGKLEKPPKQSKKFVTMWRSLVIIATLLAGSFVAGVLGTKAAPWVQLVLAVGVVLIPFTYLVGAHTMETIILGVLAKIRGGRIPRGPTTSPGGAGA